MGACRVSDTKYADFNMADFEYTCSVCTLKVYGKFDTCPACGSKNAVSRTIEFHELPSAEQIYRLKQISSGYKDENHGR